jgi:phosphate/sulfate permease
MENYYLVIVIFLFILAISDLVVGVSNDAVNFLNSAIGSKAAPYRIIMVVAAAGVLFGATFSSGMMEIARSGIIHPDQFFFQEIMVIFLAVMITDVILLDMFNTFGLPTSTTVSIVFELLGAAVAVSILKITQSAESLADLYTYINSAKALAIISGILISVVVAFTVGAIVQYITRFIFTFNYKRTYAYFGAIFGSVAITAITYFMVVKGAKGASFMDPALVESIETNALRILIVSFLGWAVLLQLLIWFTKVNILKVVVLAGTFALAMAFAGNDLVNFIGVPLAGYESFKTFLAHPETNPALMSMEMLRDPVKTPTLFLLIAGGVMVITLWTSRKARTVVETSVDLSRKGEGEERFESTYLARAIVRGSIQVGNTIRTILPRPVERIMDKRFNAKIPKKLRDESLAFDLVRASVNLVVASILIASATALKLPLSTTYVTFMVAMGTSFADGAWDRESAVYRITGVITVVGGWFFTAFSAFTAAFIVAMIISFGGMVGTLLMLVLVAFLVIRTHTLHKRRDKEKHKNDIPLSEKALTSSKILDKCNENVTSTIITVSKLYYLTILSLIEEKRGKLKKVKSDVKVLNQQIKESKNNIHKTIARLQDDSIESGHYYVQVVDYLRETAHCLTYIVQPVYEHVDNNHSPMVINQTTDLRQLNEDISSFFNLMLHSIKNQRFDNIDSITSKQVQLLETIDKLRKKQVKMIKKEEISTKNSLLFLSLLSESKNLLLFTVNLLKSMRDFHKETKERAK